MLEVMKIMMTSFKRSNARTATLSAHLVLYSYRSKLGLRCTWTRSSKPFCRDSSVSPLTGTHTQNSVHSGEVECLWKLKKCVVLVGAKDLG